MRRTSLLSMFSCKRLTSVSSGSVVSEMKHLFIILALLILFLSCNKNEEKQITSLLETATVELTKAEICEISLLYERGLEGDMCIVNCMLKGEGRNNAGGCYHNCYAYSDIRWVKFPETEKCYPDLIHSDSPALLSL